ncbi:MAG: HD domain-containing protein [Gemmatimonadaceae bacterium]|nr:HD domain-containing protein [Gemmatimonadaceae bacterium]
MNETTRFVQLLGQALATMALYDTGHPARAAVVARTHDALVRALATDGPVRLSFLGDTVASGARLLEGIVRWEWGDRLARAGVQRLEADGAPLPTHDDMAALLGELRTRLDAPAQLRGPWSRRGLRAGPVSIATQEGGATPASTRPGAVDALGRLAEHGFTEEAGLVLYLHDMAAQRGRVPMAEAEAVVHALAAVVLAERDMLPPLLELRSFDEYTTTHSCNVSMLSIGLAERLGLGSREVRAVGVAALLHDIGKVRVPTEVLSKPGRLTDEEHNLVKSHPVEGARILAGGNDDWLSATVAYEHHIHWHGRGGYPVFTHPRVTHYASRIVQICDIYDAMCTDRPYRKALHPAKAISIMREGAGTQVDPQMFPVFEAFVVRTLGLTAEDERKHAS